MVWDTNIVDDPEARRRLGDFKDERGCPKHPKYKGLRYPRKGLMPGQPACEGCIQIWKSNREAGIRETRKRKAVLVEESPAIAGS